MRSATRKKTDRDPAYLDYIRSQPCCVCVKLGVKQTSITEACHSGPRGLSQKCPDRECIALCAEHHRTTQFSQHALGRRFWGHYDLSLESLLRMYQENYDGRGNSTISGMELIA